MFVHFVSFVVALNIYIIQLCIRKFGVYLLFLIINSLVISVNYDLLWAWYNSFSL